MDVFKYEAKDNEFQFHKVRLKVMLLPKNKPVPRFQFHKVRLKVFHVALTGRIPTWFQFHKVRLKVMSGELAYIPSEFQFHKVRLKEREELDLLCL